MLRTICSDWPSPIKTNDYVSYPAKWPDSELVVAIRKFSLGQATTIYGRRIDKANHFRDVPSIL